jgi:hypothetical protein
VKTFLILTEELQIEMAAIKVLKRVFMFAPCNNSIKNTFIVPTDAHYYKIIEMLKQFKTVTFTPTCFGSRRNHHQGAVLCFAKTTSVVFYCARRHRRSQCYGGISACCAGVRFTVEEGTP